MDIFRGGLVTDLIVLSLLFITYSTGLFVLADKQQWAPETLKRTLVIGLLGIVIGYMMFGIYKQI